MKTVSQSWKRLKPDFCESEPLYVQFAGKLRSMIRSGEIKEGDRVPSSREFQSLLSLSAITIENGLNILVEEKYLLRRPRLGTFVAPMPAESLAAEKEILLEKERDFIIVLFCNMSPRGDYWYQVLARIENQAKLAGYDLFFRQIQSSGDLSSLRLKGCRGVVMCGYNSEKLARELEKLGIPVVLVGSLDDDKSQSDDLDMVIHNDEERATISIRHLLDLEHRRIACVTGPKDSQYSMRHKNGFMAAMNEYGVPFSQANFFDLNGLNYEDGIDAGYKILCQTPRFTGIFAASEMIAIGILRVAEKLGVDIPKDVSIISCGGSLISLTSNPQLTSTDSKPQECADIAAGKILERIRNPMTPKSVSVVRVTDIHFGHSTMLFRERQGNFAVSLQS